MADFETNYPQNPWISMEQNKRNWYVPELYQMYRQNTVYNRLVETRINAVPGATEMYLDTILLPEANNNALGVRDLWTDAFGLDSKRRKVVYSRYGGKVSLNRYEDIVNYWTMGDARGIRGILTGPNGLGYHMVEVMEKLARNAFLSSPPRAYYNGTGVDFGDIDTTHTVTTAMIDDIILGMTERGQLPSFQSMDGRPGSLVCITSPGVIRDLRYEASQNGNTNALIDIAKYSPEFNRHILQGEMFTYHGVRFVQSNRACLYNVGPQDNGLQTTITAAAAQGSGAPDPATTTVDGIEYVGQPSATHYITVASTAGLVAGQRVTIHTARTNAHGVTNAPDFTHGKTHDYYVNSVVDATKFTVKEPLKGNYTTDLGSGVYGYVTLARNIHTALFVAASNGVVQAVAQPPTVHTPPPIDDFDMIQRFTWDGYFGYNVFEKEAFEVAYLAASNRDIGQRYIR